jgi:WD40 repeat protein
LEGHAIPFYHIAFSPDGKLLATGSEDGELKIWNVEPAKNPQESPPPTP